MNTSVFAINLTKSHCFWCQNFFQLEEITQKNKKVRGVGGGGCSSTNIKFNIHLNIFKILFGMEAWSPTFNYKA